VQPCALFSSKPAAVALVTADCSTAALLPAESKREREEPRSTGCCLTHQRFKLRSLAMSANLPGGCIIQRQISSFRDRPCEAHWQPRFGVATSREDNWWINSYNAQRPRKRAKTTRELRRRMISPVAREHLRVDNLIATRHGKGSYIGARQLHGCGERIRII